MSTRKFIRKQKIYRFKVIQLSQKNHAEQRKRGIAYDIITTFRTVRRQREVLALYMERDMNVTQIAAVLGVNKSTVSRSLHRALRRLERCLRYSF